MVFNWFDRQNSSPGKTTPKVPSSQESSLASADDSSTASASTVVDLQPANSTAPVDPIASGCSSETTLSQEEEDEALVWAREAYACLKAQQQQATAGSRPTTPEQKPKPPAPNSSASPSLLEQAAAQRQQRQHEQEVRALEVDTEPTLTHKAPAATTDPVKLTLGAFDSNFTWSAEVLAAQGRRVDQISLEEIDWLGRLRRGLEKTRRGFVTGLLESFGDDPLTPAVLEDLETLLLRADAGVQATDQMLKALRQRMNEEIVDPIEGIRFLKNQLRDLLDAPIQASGVSLLAPERDHLNIWLMVGVNGAGKTTTLGKLANLAVRSGYSALIAAADTFRAAAVQQVQIWGDRSDVSVISNSSSNADPAAVVFDAIGSARSRGIDLLLVDTAGRLQTKHNLMEELQKIRNIIDRLAPKANVESLLVLDASQGQNGLRQAMAFARATRLTGVVITKLDSTARGGVALAVSSEAGLPIRFIGAGEGIRDLRPFNSFEFVEALLAR
ncbi:signal recognition particle-docking protein FtsY [Synechococcus sp. M16CYN]|uniref:signal recognition particle-docking protein FtsY n=1 Tax=Synechococcus sp. M16CYN TaxID=3103139 RepID=UPI003243A8B8